ncbi:hypothetical protein HT031_003902 [Scenedesmus sp. PABB004]|nr:hypothetical protein HT031_003902 [Scenedesmus sp. PABB004]
MEPPASGASAPFTLEDAAAAGVLRGDQAQAAAVGAELALAGQPSRVLRMLQTAEARRSLRPRARARARASTPTSPQASVDPRDAAALVPGALLASQPGSLDPAAPRRACSGGGPTVVDAPPAPLQLPAVASLAGSRTRAKLRHEAAHSPAGGDEPGRGQDQGGGELEAGAGDGADAASSSADATRTHGSGGGRRQRQAQADPGPHHQLRSWAPDAGGFVAVPAACAPPLAGGLQLAGAPHQHYVLPGPGGAYYLPAQLPHPWAASVAAQQLAWAPGLAATRDVSSWGGVRAGAAGALPLVPGAHASGGWLGSPARAGVAAEAAAGGRELPELASWPAGCSSMDPASLMRWLHVSHARRQVLPELPAAVVRHLVDAQIAAGPAHAPWYRRGGGQRAGALGGAAPGGGSDDDAAPPAAPGTPGVPASWPASGGAGVAAWLAGGSAADLTAGGEAQAPAAVRPRGTGVFIPSAHLLRAESEEPPPGS